FGVGLLLGLVVALGGGWALLRGARAQLEDDWITRRAIVAANALGALVGQAPDDAAVRKAVTAWQETHPPGTRVRVIRGTTLEASTEPADTGEKAAPRRLAREEKPLYDQAQRLRAGVDTNREGGAPSGGAARGGREGDGHGARPRAGRRVDWPPLAAPGGAAALRRDAPLRAGGVAAAA